jgi:hypothetical protein
MIGAPERLLAACNRQWRDGHPEPLDLRHWHQALDSYRQGLHARSMAGSTACERAAANARLSGP